MLRKWLEEAIASSELFTAFRKQFVADCVAKIAEDIELPETTADHEELARAVLYFESIAALRRWQELLMLGRGESFGTARAFAFTCEQIAERLWVAAARLQTGVILTAATICSVPSTVLQARGFTLPNIPKCQACEHDMTLHRCARRDSEKETRSCVLCDCDIMIPVTENSPGVSTDVTPVAH